MLLLSLNSIIYHSYLILQFINLLSRFFLANQSQLFGIASTKIISEVTFFSNMALSTGQLFFQIDIE